MKNNKKLKLYTLEELINKYIGSKKSKKRVKYEKRLKKALKQHNYVRI